ncbi:polymer-forming cytoskeletal protein [bacterium]|nr:polymer-forming cytoskeletal protein [bacterium]
MASAAKTALSAYLGRGTKFKGELRFSGILRIDGILEGQILSEGTLSIGESGVVKGEIKVGELLISGVADGVIEATRLIDVAGSGKLFGRLLAPSIHIAEGVVLQAEVRVGAPDRKPFQ